MSSLNGLNGLANGQTGPEEPKYIQFPRIEHGTLRDGEPILNRWSSTLTAGHNFPGAQVCHIFPLL